eukprot:CAMPEP_0179177158 /NCGR_PEP_ID=MMETSP0796-20121207/87608_1 /TAXON_ID=73915 /ORGANISM="Pyrodinium bahamense, Strain pbaha01" /LENGTH=79 /DNA_ID=CAMNT_0020880705 /DNA_START=73 /DNA_END=312 /DNA_ORIENTATION=+
MELRVLPKGQPPVPAPQPKGEPPVLPKPPQPANGETLPNGGGLPKAGWTEPMSPEVAAAPKGLPDKDGAVPKGHAVLSA